MSVAIREKFIFFLLIFAIILSSTQNSSAYIQDPYAEPPGWDIFQNYEKNEANVQSWLDERLKSIDQEAAAKFGGTISTREAQNWRLSQIKIARAAAADRLKEFKSNPSRGTSEQKQQTTSKMEQILGGFKFDANKTDDFLKTSAPLTGSPFQATSVAASAPLNTTSSTNTFQDPRVLSLKARYEKIQSQLGSDLTAVANEENQEKQKKKEMYLNWAKDEDQAAADFHDFPKRGSLPEGIYKPMLDDWASKRAEGDISSASKKAYYDGKRDEAKSNAAIGLSLLDQEADKVRGKQLENENQQVSSFMDKWRSDVDEKASWYVNNQKVADDGKIDRYQAARVFGMKDSLASKGMLTADEQKNFQLSNGKTVDIYGNNIFNLRDTNGNKLDADDVIDLNRRLESTAQSKAQSKAYQATRDLDADLSKLKDLTAKDRDALARGQSSNSSDGSKSIATSSGTPAAVASAAGVPVAKAGPEAQTPFEPSSPAASELPEAAESVSMSKMATLEGNPAYALPSRGGSLSGAQAATKSPDLSADTSTSKSKSSGSAGTALTAVPAVSGFTSASQASALVPYFLCEQKPGVASGNCDLSSLSAQKQAGIQASLDKMNALLNQMLAEKNSGKKTDTSLAKLAAEWKSFYAIAQSSGNPELIRMSGNTGLALKAAATDIQSGKIKTSFASIQDVYRYAKADPKTFSSLRAPMQKITSPAAAPDTFSPKDAALSMSKLSSETLAARDSRSVPGVDLGSDGVRIDHSNPNAVCDEYSGTHCL